MLKKVGLLAGAALLALGLGTGGAYADDCSGHDHAAGTILGAIAGAAIGSAASHGNGGAVAAGAIFGGLAGNAISRDIDCDDRDDVGRAYHESFYGDVGERYEWEGHGGGHGYIVTNREYRRHGHKCRDFTQVVYRRGQEYTRDGTACHYDGEWHFMDDSD
ncbi:MAG TPA: glycine zipper domain-containing protein [Rhizomicrobium sp.]